ESSAFCDSNLLSGWFSYVRADYRDSLNNESHWLLYCSLIEQRSLIADLRLLLTQVYTKLTYT
ncbi:MAG: hypothetical protein V7K70_01290, partial [Nostoc sp.]